MVLRGGRRWQARARVLACMTQKIRFGEFVREMTINQRYVSYNELTPKPLVDSSGAMVPIRPERLRLRPMDIRRLLAPYVGTRVSEQLRTVVPLGLYLGLFQIVILRQPVMDAGFIVAGFVAVIIGLTLFMEGLRLGLMPFGEIIGDTLPKKSRLPIVLLLMFLLGVGVTYAEPAISALQAVGPILSPHDAPYLYSLLNFHSNQVVLAVGAGVGIAAVVGTIRFLRGWSLKPVIYWSMVPCVLMVVGMAWNPGLVNTLGLAWDCGAVTTGPVTVPLVLALGLGIASAAGKGSSSLSGFGIVTLASLYPIILVMALALFVVATETPEQIIAAAALATQHSELPWFERSPWVEVVHGFRAILPLVAFLMIVLKFVLRERLREVGIVAYGIGLCLLGMCLFNLGLSYGMTALGSQSGDTVAAAFARLESVADSPLYSVPVGISIALAFGWALGFGATMAEPALHALGVTVEDVTNGAFRKHTLMYTVAAGVGVGLAIGILKIIFALPLAWLIVGSYAVAVLLTMFSTEEFVNVAWDAAGVTTGEVTVPLVLAMGLGFGSATHAVEGFGILTMASVWPITTVLAAGLWVQYSARRRMRAEERAEARVPQQ